MMRRFLIGFAAALGAVFLWATPSQHGVRFAIPEALAQASVLQAGPPTSGHAPMYSTGGSFGQAILQDSGPASGGAPGLGLYETLQVSPPVNGQYNVPGSGSGPLGAHNCEFSAPTASGGFYVNPVFNYLCFDANIGGLPTIAVSTPTLQVILGNGQVVQIPGSVSGNVVGPNSSTDGDIALFNGPTGKLLKDSGFSPSNFRQTISTPAAFYVNASGGNATCHGIVNGCGPGSDSNPGTQAAPWQHLQYALDFIALNYNIGAQTILYMADGTYAENISLPNWTGTFQRYDTLSNAFSQTNGEPIIEGHVGSPGSVIVAGTSVDFTAGGLYAEWLINDLTVSNANGAQAGFVLDWDSTLDLGNVNFTGFSAEGISSRYNSPLEILGGAAITISGSMPSFAYATANGIILAHNPGSPDVTITLTGTPAFANGFIRTDQSSAVVDFGAVSYSGSATGLPYQIGNLNAFGSGGMPSWFPNLPGNEAGSLVGPRFVATTAGTTFYVNENNTTSPCGIGGASTCGAGSDVTGNGSLANPWASINHAINWITDNLDPLGNAVTIYVANGTTYAGFLVSAPLVGGVALQIIGNGSNIDDVAITGSGDCGNISNYANVFVESLKCTSSGADGFFVSNGAQLTEIGLDMGATGSGNSQFHIANNGILHLDGNYTISGGAGNHIFLQGGSVDVLAVMTVSIPNATTFSGAFITAQDKGVSLINSNVTYSVAVSVTAQRYAAATGAVIDTGQAGATFFPGNSGGTTTCAVTAGAVGTGSIGVCGEYNFLLNRDLGEPANDNLIAGLGEAA